MIIRLKMIMSTMLSWRMYPKCISIMLVWHDTLVSKNPLTNVSDSPLFSTLFFFCNFFSRFANDLDQQKPFWSNIDFCHCIWLVFEMKPFEQHLIIFFLFRKSPTRFRCIFNESLWDVIWVEFRLGERWSIILFVSLCNWKRRKSKGWKRRKKQRRHRATVIITFLLVPYK